MPSFKLILGVYLAVLLCGVAQAQQPILTLDRSVSPARIGVNGGLGQGYTLEGTTNNMAWDFLLNLTLTNSTQSWSDASSTLMPIRLYRAFSTNENMGVGPGFRLTDHLGRSHSLVYYQNSPSLQTNVRVITLIFTGNGCSTIRDLIPTIKALTNRFTPQGVLFWLIDSNQQDNRSNILVEATSLGISNGPPILYDAAGLVARAYHPKNPGVLPEAVAINMANYTIFYRGAIDDRIGSNAVVTTQSYLSNALGNFLADQPVSWNRSAPAGCPVNLKPSFTNLSYSTDVAPLLQAKCVRCHSPGNIAPWQMTNYNAVVDHASNIRTELRAGRMPPWHADPTYGVFTNDYSVTPDQAAKLVQWIDEGSQRGIGPDPLAVEITTTNYPFAWPTNLGQPDVIYRIPLQSIAASGVDSNGNYRLIPVTTTLGSNIWLRAAILRPTNIKVVHHCLVFDGSGSSIFGIQGLDGFFAGYVPGADPNSFPPNTGKMLTIGEVLQFQMHYTTIGTPQTDQTELGLYFSPAPPTYPLQTKSAYNIGIVVPANSAQYQTSARFPASVNLATNILLFDLEPHMHLRGNWFKFEVVYPNGTRETLLSVPNYVFLWQTTYRLTTPKYVPKGAYIVCSGGYDNTTQNGDLMNAYYSSSDVRFLPNHTVFFQQQSYDEMFIGYMDYIEVSGPPP